MRKMLLAEAFVLVACRFPELSHVRPPICGHAAAPFVRGCTTCEPTSEKRYRPSGPRPLTGTELCAAPRAEPARTSVRREDLCPIPASWGPNRAEHLSCAGRGDKLLRFRHTSRDLKWGAAGLESKRTGRIP